MIEVIKEIAGWNPVRGSMIDDQKLEENTKCISYNELKSSDWEKVRYLYARSGDRVNNQGRAGKGQLSGCYLSVNGTWLLLCGEERVLHTVWWR